MTLIKNMSRSIWSCRVPSPLSTSLVLTLAISFLLNISTLVFQLRVIARGERTYTYIGDDRPRELPIKVRTVNLAFHDDPIYYHMEGDNATAEWNAIRPPGQGFIFLGDEFFAFGVSMWHQMHCLNHIRAMFVHGDDGSDHTEHCFHYLRQGILCAADTTLEPGGTGVINENGHKVANGVDVVHTCRDWGQVHDWMAEQYAKWTPEQLVKIKIPSDHAGHGIGGEHMYDREGYEPYPEM